MRRRLLSGRLLGSLSVLARLAGRLSRFPLLGLFARTAARGSARQRLTVRADARNIARQIGHAHTAGVGAAVMVTPGSLTGRVLGRTRVLALAHAPKQLGYGDRLFRAASAPRLFAS